MIYRLSAALALALFAATSEAVVLRNQIAVEDDSEPLEGITLDGDIDHPSVDLDINVNGEDADGIPDDQEKEADEDADPCDDNNIDLDITVDLDLSK